MDVRATVVWQRMAACGSVWQRVAASGGVHGYLLHRRFMLQDGSRGRCLRGPSSSSFIAVLASPQGI